LARGRLAEALRERTLGPADGFGQPAAWAALPSAVRIARLSSRKNDIRRRTPPRPSVRAAGRRETGRGSGRRRACADFFKAGRIVLCVLPNVG
jgi:hypothetical protein